ncbi:FIG domain-containing protein [Actinomadura physcomitrii]|uniref:hypothetical protein n=1 Tax=Actinomadura physcomitrii TaxID=2650748 RepID=UPI001922651F|nr:hypothetical protein [Actinomadura physcomitrii]
MTDAPASLLPVALKAAEIASDLVRTRVPGLLTAKGDRDMASEVDYAVERAVRDYLKERTPDIAAAATGAAPPPTLCNTRGRVEQPVTPGKEQRLPSTVRDPLDLFGQATNYFGCRDVASWGERRGALPTPIC